MVEPVSYTHLDVYKRQSANIGELPNGVPNNLIPYVTQTAMGIRKELTIRCV